MEKLRNAINPGRLHRVDSLASELIQAVTVCDHGFVEQVAFVESPLRKATLAQLCPVVRTGMNILFIIWGKDADVLIRLVSFVQDPCTHRIVSDRHPTIRSVVAFRS